MFKAILKSFLSNLFCKLDKILHMQNLKITYKLPLLYTIPTKTESYIYSVCSSNKPSIVPQILRQSTAMLPQVIRSVGWKQQQQKKKNTKKTKWTVKAYISEKAWQIQLKFRIRCMPQSWGNLHSIICQFVFGK